MERDMLQVGQLFHLLYLERELSFLCLDGVLLLGLHVIMKIFQCAYNTNTYLELLNPCESNKLTTIRSQSMFQQGAQSIHKDPLITLNTKMQQRTYLHVCLESIMITFKNSNIPQAPFTIQEFSRGLMSLAVTGST